MLSCFPKLFSKCLVAFVGFTHYCSLLFKDQSGHQKREELQCSLQKSLRYQYIRHCKPEIIFSCIFRLCQMTAMVVTVSMITCAISQYLQIPLWISLPDIPKTTITIFASPSFSQTTNSSTVLWGQPIRLIH